MDDPGGRHGNEHPADGEPDEARLDILVVEDDAAIRQPIVFALGGAYRVREVGTAEEARALLASRTPRLLILDIRLTDGDGLDLLAEFRQVSAAPVLIITAHGTEDVAARALDLRANSYLKKPFALATIRQRADALLAEGPRPEHLAELARAHIETLVTTPVSAEEIATHLGVASDRLLIVFRERFGCTPVQYLRRVRLDTARRLLLTTDLSVMDIASQSGLQDPAYLARLFKERFGMPPLAFRRAHLAPSDPAAGSPPPETA